MDASTQRRAYMFRRTVALEHLVDKREADGDVEGARALLRSLLGFLTTQRAQDEQLLRSKLKQQQDKRASNGVPNQDTSKDAGARNGHDHGGAGGAYTISLATTNGATELKELRSRYAAFMDVYLERLHNLGAQQDALRQETGGLAVGDQSPHAKVTLQQVAECRELKRLGNNVRKAKLAAMADNARDMAQRYREAVRQKTAASSTARGRVNLTRSRASPVKQTALDHPQGKRTRGFDAQDASSSSSSSSSAAVGSSSSSSSSAHAAKRQRVQQHAASAFYDLSQESQEDVRARSSSSSSSSGGGSSVMNKGDFVTAKRQMHLDNQQNGQAGRNGTGKGAGKRKGLRRRTKMSSQLDASNKSYRGKDILEGAEDGEEIGSFSGGPSYSFNQNPSATLGGNGRNKRGGSGSSKKQKEGEKGEYERANPPEMYEDERLKNVDPKMIDMITNEILDHGEPVTWADIAGLEFAKKTVNEMVIYPMLRPDIFTGLRAPPKGLLLFGPPGTGKTLICKAIAHESKATFFSISSSTLTSKWVGEGEKMVKALFKVAAYFQPSVIFIDEIDSLLTARKEDDTESSRRIKTEFLVQFDGAGVSSEDRILVVGATNCPDQLDEAAKRRLAKRLYIPLPGPEARQQLITRLLEKNKEVHSLGSDELNEIVRLSKGYSGSDLKHLCEEAAMGPVRDCVDITNTSKGDMRPIMLKDFLDALKLARASVSQKDLKLFLDWNVDYGSFQFPDVDEDAEWEKRQAEQKAQTADKVQAASASDNTNTNTNAMDVEIE